MVRTYRVGEVARMVDVSVRTLHHYDERGLLVPPARSDAGYRLYTDDDLARLVEILALRALGMRLDRIAALLDGPGVDPERALRLQRLALRRQIQELEALDQAIDAALTEHERTGYWNWIGVLRQPPRLTPLELEEIVEKHFTSEQLAAYERLGEEIGPEEIAAVERGWAELIPEVRAARASGLAPDDPRARALGRRWSDLVARSFRGRSQLRDTVGAAYEAGAFAADPSLPTQDDFAFIAAIERAQGD